MSSLAAHKAVQQCSKDLFCIGSNSSSPATKKRCKGTATPPDADARAGLLGEALHLLKRSQAVGESGIEALNGEGEGEGGLQELENNIVGADATIKAWRLMQVRVPPLKKASHAFQLSLWHLGLQPAQESSLVSVVLTAYWRSELG